jgi:hypothetical protein
MAESLSLGQAPSVRNARREAFERLGGRFDPRVLEPSPPAEATAPFFADDPVSGGDLVPIERAGTTSWNALCAEGSDPALGAWCAERWLGAWKRLEPLPPTYTETTAALHAIAEHVLAADRYARCAKIGLRYTYRGFGTPFVDPEHQARIEGTELVTTTAGATQRAPLTTIRDAAKLVGCEPGAPSHIYTPTTSPAFDEPLRVDRAAAFALGDWYGFCCSVLEQVRSDAAEASRVQLWPEHFDLAVELGDEAAGARAAFGGSPGDDAHPQPYLYISRWQQRSDDEFWNEPFGASLAYRDLLAASDQRATALEFFRRGRTLLTEGR